MDAYNAMLGPGGGGGTGGGGGVPGGTNSISPWTYPTGPNTGGGPGAAGPAIPGGSQPGPLTRGGGPSGGVASQPVAPGLFNQSGGGLGNVTASFINNPYGNPQFAFERQLGQSNANQQNQGNLNQLMQNFMASGQGGGLQSPFMQEMMANQMRASTGNSAMQGFISPTAMANQRQQQAMQLASGFRPLQTGGTTVQSTGGLGTWLPQVAGMALGAATGGLGGGLMAGMGGLGKLFGGGQQASYNPNDYINSGGFGNSVMGASGSQPGQGFWGQYGGSGYTPFGGDLMAPPMSGAGISPTFANNFLSGGSGIFSPPSWMGTPGIVPSPGGGY